jgi:hypothetical protein
MIPFPEKVFLRGSSELEFFSVRHNANPTQGVNFQDPCVGMIVGIVVHGNWPYGPSRSLQNSIISLDCDFVPCRPNFHCVPEWLQEANCNMP